MKFKPIRPKKISSQIAEQIKSSILAGEFNPGEKLPPERELAEMFGVSRPPVREALNILASAGMVESFQGGGTVVKSLVEIKGGSPLSEMIKDVQERALDVIEVRKCMETWTAYFAAQRALPEDLRRLEKIVEEMGENLALVKPSQDLDANFHIGIAQATHNIVWLHLMQSIYDSLKVFQRSVWRAVYITPEDHRTLYAQHANVLAALRDRDPDRAREVMLQHLNFAEKRSSVYLARKGEPDD